MEPGRLHEMIKPLRWLVGKWRSISADGKYPTISPFKYCEEIEFVSYGQPTLNYSSKTWNPETKLPIHFESGFLRIKPNTNEVALLSAHNFGITSVEQGTVNNNHLHLKSINISRMHFAKEPSVTGLERTYSINSNNNLEIIVYMETTKTPLTEHLRIIYDKVE